MDREDRDLREPERPDPSQLNAIEKFYEHFRKVPIKYLDVFIALCAAALVAVVVLGALKGHGIV